MRQCSSFCAVAVFGLLVLVGANLRGQDDAEPPANAAEAAKSNAEDEKRRGPLPAYFGKIGVSDEQREKLYDIQDEYEARLEELRQQLKALVRERDAKLESLLTPGQKLRLKELREEARRRAQSKPTATSSE